MSEGLFNLIQPAWPTNHGLKRWKLASDCPNHNRREEAGLRTFCIKVQGGDSICEIWAEWSRNQWVPDLRLCYLHGKLRPEWVVEEVADLSSFVPRLVLNGLVQLWKTKRPTEVPPMQCCRQLRAHSISFTRFDEETSHIKPKTTLAYFPESHLEVKYDDG